MPFEKSNSRKGASVLKEFASFNWGSVGYIFWIKDYKY